MSPLDSLLIAFGATAICAPIASVLMEWLIVAMTGPRARE